MEGTSGVSTDERDLANSLESKLSNLKPFSTKCCIYTVPVRLRLQNPKAYTPRVVSIGPLHHDKDELKAMEEQKLHYLKSFLGRTNVRLGDYVNFVKEREEKVRNHYAESFEAMTSNKFVQMVLVDAAFVVELLWKNHYETSVEETDRIYKRPWKVVEIRLDLMLLENQLPFFILEDVFELTKHSIGEVSLIELTHKFFQFKAHLGGLGVEDIMKKLLYSDKINHFVDFFRRCHVPGEFFTGPIKTLTIPSVTELYNAGITFEVGSSTSLFDIQFRDNTLVIPHLRIRKSTESFFLNLLAFEQCHLLPFYINDYVFIIDRLVDSTKAVELLTRSKVIQSRLPDKQEVVTSIDTLTRGSIMRHQQFNFNELCNRLNAYYSNPWNTWMTTFMHEHFNSPWTIIAIIVAILFFILTILQTICSCRN